MNDYFYVSGICAAICLLIFITTVNLDEFLPYKAYKEKLLMWACYVPFWISGAVGCISFALGCWVNIT